MSISSLRLLNVYLMDMQHICTIRYEIIKNMKYSAHTMGSQPKFIENMKYSAQTMKSQPRFSLFSFSKGI